MFDWTKKKSGVTEDGATLEDLRELKEKIN